MVSKSLLCFKSAATLLRLKKKIDATLRAHKRGAADYHLCNTCWGRRRWAAKSCLFPAPQARWASFAFLMAFGTVFV